MTVQLVGYACKEPAPPLRHVFVPLGELLVLVGANDVGKSSLLRAITRDLNGGHFAEADEETAKLTGGVFYSELTTAELTDLIKETAFGRQRLKNDHQARPDSDRPPYDAGLWKLRLSDDGVLAETVTQLIEDLRKTEQDRPEQQALFSYLEQSTLVGFECAGRDRSGKRVWNAYWCVPPVAELNTTARLSAEQSNIESFARESEARRGERWSRGRSAFYEGSYGRPIHLWHKDAPVALVSLGSTTDVPLPRALAVPTGFQGVRDAVSEGINSLAEVIEFAREDIRLDGDELSPGEREARRAPGSWLEARIGDGYSISHSAQAACAFIAFAANQALPPFIADRYRLILRFRNPPDWFTLGPLEIEFCPVDEGSSTFAIEHAAEGFRLWVQLAILDALEEAGRVETFLWNLASDWFDVARDAAQLHGFEDPAAEDMAQEAEGLSHRFDAATSTLLDLGTHGPPETPSELLTFLADTAELDWTKNKKRVGRLFVVDEPERHLQPRLQRRAANWLAETSAARQAPFCMATHSPPFLSLPANIARYVLVDRQGDQTKLTPFEPSDLTQLDEVATTLTFDRGELLASVAVWLVVEGATDVTVLRRLFPRELHEAGIGLVPLNGTAYWRGILEADALWRYTRVPIAVMFDNVPAERVEALNDASNEELAALVSAPLKDRPAEIGSMAKLVLTARENGKIVHPVPNSHDDMLGHLDEEAIAEVSGGQYPGHAAAHEQWERHRKGSRDEFYKRRYRLEKRPDTFLAIADRMVEQGWEALGLKAALEYCAGLADTDPAGAAPSAPKDSETAEPASTAVSEDQQSSGD